MIVSKVLVQVVIVSGISSYASQCGLADWQKDSYESLTSVAGKFREKKGIVIQDIFAEMLKLVQKIKWIVIMDLLWFCRVFHVRKNIVKTSLDIIGERFMKDVNGLLVVSDEDKEITSNVYHEKF